MIFDANALLIEVGRKKDSDINLCECAIAMAATAHEGISIERYIHHVEKLTRDVGLRFKSLIDSGADDDARTRLAALKHILSDQEGYEGDNETYDDLQNADVMRVIDRRKGMPISLALLYIQVGRNNGFKLDGLNFPGHFLCRIEHDGQRLIFDAFQRCEVMEAPDLRQLIKQIKGANAELSADYYQSANNRQMLIRLQNNIKLRLIDASDYKGAIQSVEMMRHIDPKEYRLLFDAGVLYVKTGNITAAKDVLEEYLKQNLDYAERRDAENILLQISELD